VKTWDICTFEFPFGVHPAVIISPQPWLDDQRVKVVNVLACSSRRANRQPSLYEAILDEADGLEWPTLCACQFIYAAPKTELKEYRNSRSQRGCVTTERRRQVCSTIIRVFGLYQP
jgi:hypothetical protein